ncbi:phosphate transporter [Clavulina sp. PMI_390]|nr:phosphate transporter [Clavulina sp. PMI_390]
MGDIRPNDPEPRHSASSDGSHAAMHAPVIVQTHGLTAERANEIRLATYRDIDNAKYSGYHDRAVYTAGAGFATDAYDTFAISIAVAMIGYSHGVPASSGSNILPALPIWQDFGLKVATLFGNLVGQLVFGWLADRKGRKTMYGIVLTIMIIGTFVQSLSGGSESVNIIGTIIFWRFCTGVGIGGDYPITALITSEFAATEIRGQMMAAVFSAQAWGTLLSAIVSLIIVAGFKDGMLDQSNYAAVDSSWRLLIGLGCIPAVIALYFRKGLPETPRYTSDVKMNLAQTRHDVEQLQADEEYEDRWDIPVVHVEAPAASPEDFWEYFSQRKNAVTLFATCWTWFAQDIAFYGLILNSSTFIKSIAGAPQYASPGQNAYHELFNISLGNVIIALGGLLPGSLAAFLLIDRWGRRPLQKLGFAALIIIFLCMGFGYDSMIVKGNAHSRGAFGFLYCLAMFFANLGPNTTTFVIPGEIFPTRYRATCHGISAASGKVGAIIAQVVITFRNLGGNSDGSTLNPFLGHVLEIYTAIMITGLAATWLLPEPAGKTLEELSNEAQESYIMAVRQPQQFNPGPAVEHI